MRARVTSQLKWMGIKFCGVFECWEKKKKERTKSDANFYTFKTKYKLVQCGFFCLFKWLVFFIYFMEIEVKMHQLFEITIDR